MEEELIDVGIEETPKDIILDIIRWWERKRIMFNLINVLFIIIAIINYFYSQKYASASAFGPGFFIQSFLYFIFINACYCAGWVVQLLGYYYFKIQYDSKSLDYVLFVIGTLFTVFVTYVGYCEYLRFH